MLCYSTFAASGRLRERSYTVRMERQLEYVLRTVEERGVRFVRLWFTDVLGFLKSVEITPAELEVALEEGMTFDGSTIEGYSRIQESDMLAKPDPNEPSIGFGMKVAYAPRSAATCLTATRKVITLSAMVSASV